MTQDPRLECRVILKMHLHGVDGHRGADRISAASTEVRARCRAVILRAEIMVRCLAEMAEALQTTWITVRITEALAAGTHRALTEGLWPADMALTEEAAILSLTEALWQADEALTAAIQVRAMAEEVSLPRETSAVPMPLAETWAVISDLIRGSTAEEAPISRITDPLLRVECTAHMQEVTITSVRI